MSRSNRLLASVFVVLVSVGAIQGLCNLGELSILLGIASPYEDLFTPAIGTTAPCIRTLITAELCSLYASIVTSANAANVSRITCRPYMIAQIDPLLPIPCKTIDFVETCIGAPVIDTGI